MPCNHWDCGSLPRSYGAPCGDGKYRVPWRNCVSPQRFHLPVHHQYAILPLSTNMKATSAPARSRCCNSYWLSGGVSGLSIRYQGSVGYLTSERREQVLAWLKQQQTWNLAELMTCVRDTCGVVYQSKQSYYDLFAQAGISWNRSKVLGIWGATL